MSASCAHTRAFAPTRPTTRQRHRRCSTPVVRALDTSGTIAATQQLVSFAVFIGGEGFWALNKVPADKGGPTVPATLAGIAAMLACTVLLQTELTQTPACIAGLGASAALMAYYIKRSKDTVGNDIDWPGPKAPPAGMALVAFFALNIFLQALLN